MLCVNVCSGGRLAGVGIFVLEISIHRQHITAAQQTAIFVSLPRSYVSAILSTWCMSRGPQFLGWPNTAQLQTAQYLMCLILPQQEVQCGTGKTSRHSITIHHFPRSFIFTIRQPFACTRLQILFRLLYCPDLILLPVGL